MRLPLAERRRHDCADLFVCEDEWNDAHSGAFLHARCPVVCHAYRRIGRQVL